MIDGERYPDQPPKMPDASGIERPIRIVLETMIRGMAASCNGVPPELLLSVIAWHTGNSLADCVVAGMEHKARYRQLIKEAFDNGMQQALQTPAPGPQ